MESLLAQQSVFSRPAVPPLGAEMDIEDKPSELSLSRDFEFEN